MKECKEEKEEISQVLDKNCIKHSFHFKRFLALEEVYKEIDKLKKSGKAKVETIGFSQEKRPIYSITLGHGKENCLIFGFPHANEPVGSLTCIALANIIMEDENLQSRFTWSIIPCSDPDGVDRNRGWLKYRFSLKKYVNNYYRGVESKQTDLSFPIEYKSYKFDKSGSHVKAIASLIRKTKPGIVCPLHDGGIGGCFILVSKKVNEGYYDRLINLCLSLNLPLHLGAPDVPFMEEVKKPIFLNYGFEESYDYYKDKSDNLDALLGFGSDSISYAKKFNKNVFGLVCEVPYILEKEIANSAPSKISKKEFLLGMNMYYRESLSFVQESLKKVNVNKNSVFYELVMRDIECSDEELRVDLEETEKLDTNIKATIAEASSYQVENDVYCSIRLSTFKRLLKDSEKTKETEALIKEIDEMIARKVKNARRISHMKNIPISKLVQMQLGAILLTLDRENQQNTQ